MLRGASYDGLGYLVEEILVAMAAGGAGVLPVGENALMALANGNTGIGNEIYQFLATKLDTTDMTRPHGYLTWLAYNKDFHLDPGRSGAVRVTDPNELGTLLSGQLEMKTDSWLHVYAGNGTSSKIKNIPALSPVRYALRFPPDAPLTATCTSPSAGCSPPKARGPR